MASISSLYPLSQYPRDYYLTAFSIKKDGLPVPAPNAIPNFAMLISPGIKRCIKQSFVACCKNHKEEEEQGPTSGWSQQEVGTKRREALIQMSVAAFSISIPAVFSNALAGEDVLQDFRVYTDDANKFKISIPNNWQVGAGGEPNGFKSITAFFPEEASSSNVSVVITGLGPDFTRMESFGKVEAFADTLVSGLDRSWKRPPGVAAKLVDCKASNGFYYIEYTLQSPGESRKHLFSAIGMAFNGWYNRLYTVTGQYVEEDTEKYSSRIKKAVESFSFI